jgi:ATP-dependent Clp protease protease subunit
MMARNLPAWMQRAREMAARVASPVGKPVAAKRSGKVCDLYLFDAIGLDPWTGEGTTPEDVVNAMKESAGADELVVHMNSPGGGVFDGMAIYNTIAAFQGTKTVRVEGLAASIASIIALAGDKIVTAEGGMWMIHDPMGGIFSFGNADQIEEDARKTTNALRKVRESLLDIYTSRTGQSLADLSAWMSSETWMTAAEAQSRGFTHEVEKAPEVEQRKTADAGELAKLRFDAMVRDRKLSQYRDAASRGPAPASRAK